MSVYVRPPELSPFPWARIVFLLITTLATVVLWVWFWTEVLQWQ